MVKLVRVFAFLVASLKARGVEELLLGRPGSLGEQR